jgi:hypothetical protein
MNISHLIANCFMALVACAAVGVQMGLLTGVVGPA